MDTNAKLEAARELVGPWARAFNTPEANRVDALIHGADLLAAVQALHQAEWGYLAAITGLDAMGRAAQFAQDERWKTAVAAWAAETGKDPATSTGPIEVLYHFCNGAAILTLRVLAVREAASVPSVCGLIPGASFFERELGEMFHVTVTGTPDLTRLFLPDDWPDGVAPLRKDFVVKSEAI